MSDSQQHQVIPHHTALREELERVHGEVRKLEKENLRLAVENARLYEAAYRDRLTGLGSRLVYEETLESLPHRIEVISMVLIDLDFFKSINDKYGHVVGDAVLARFGAILRTVSHETDTSVRIGGEEFAVILRGCNEAGAAKYAARLHSRIKEDLVIHLEDGRLVNVTASLGYAQYRGEEDPWVFYKRVDQALYAAKNAGRNCIRAADR